MNRLQPLPSRDGKHEVFFHRPSRGMEKHEGGTNRTGSTDVSGNVAATSGTGNEKRFKASAWKRWSHERMGTKDRGGREVLVRPPKMPWMLKPLKHRYVGYFHSFQLEKSSATNQEAPSVANLKPGMPLSQRKSMVNMSTFQPPMAKLKNKKSDTHGQQQKILDSEMFGLIHTVQKSILIAAADPMGDCSWSLPYPKTYEVLPELLAHAGDWASFKLVMTDLMFLWRKLQGGDQLSLLHLYEQGSLALFAQGVRSERLEAFSDFFFHHLRNLSADPNRLFAVANASRNEYVIAGLNTLLSKHSRFLDETHSSLQDEDGLGIAGKRNKVSHFSFSFLCSTNTRFYMDSSPPPYRLSERPLGWSK